MVDNDLIRNYIQSKKIKKKAISFSSSAILGMALRDYSESQGLTKSDVITQALISYIPDENVAAVITEYELEVGEEI